MEVTRSPKTKSLHAIHRGVAPEFAASSTEAAFCACGLPITGTSPPIPPHTHLHTQDTQLRSAGFRGVIEPGGGRWGTLLWSLNFGTKKAVGTSPPPKKMEENLTKGRSQSARPPSYPPGHRPRKKTSIWACSVVGQKQRGGGKSKAPGEPSLSQQRMHSPNRQQPLHHLHVTLLGGSVERRAAVVAGPVHRRPRSRRQAPMAIQSPGLSHARSRVPVTPVTHAGHAQSRALVTPSYACQSCPATVTPSHACQSCQATHQPRPNHASHTPATSQPRHSPSEFARQPRGGREVAAAARDPQWRAAVLVSLLHHRRSSGAYPVYRKTGLKQRHRDSECFSRKPASRHSQIHPPQA